MAKTYETYKDSGIAWIGEIPSEWEMGNFRYYGEFTKGKLPSTTNVEAKGLPIIGASEMLGKECRTFTEDKDVPLCGHDDILILWDGANAGIISSHHTGVVASTAVKYCCLNPDINKNYLYHLFKSLEPLFKEKVNGTTIPHMNIKYINEVPLLIPPINEQHSIASFLDTKCGEIDALISLQEEMISELQAYKQSVITEAVTKGLNPHAKMKDSGVEWIGEIPSEWEVCKMKNTIRFINGYAFDSNSFKAEGIYPVIRIGDIINEKISYDNTVFVNDNTGLENFQIHDNDILIAMSGATTGKIGKVQCNHNGYINQRVGIIRCANHSYVYYHFLTDGFIDYVNLSSIGTAQPNISSNGILNFAFIKPPLSEQYSIATYLDEKTSQIDSLISLKQEKIQELKDYKKSIIYEYVTGKKRV